MLDFELAEIYGYETKNFNRQVKNNAEKFEGDDFMFQMTPEELKMLSRCKNFTTIQTKGVKGGRTNLPYAFTESGVYMLMTVLKGDTAVKQSNIYAWSHKAYVDADGTEWDGGQIDLIIDRNDDVMNLCEMKYSNGEYIISKKYEKELRERMSMFRHVEKTKKALRCTFITTYGVKNNEHKGIVNDEIVLEDLFV